MGRSIEEDVDDYLESRTEDELRDLLADLVTTNPDVRRALHRRAMLDRGEDGELARGLARDVRSVLSGAGFIGYYEVGDYAARVSDLLDDIVELASAPGGLDIVRDPLCRLLSGLGDVLEQADDSDGQISEVRQEMVETFIDVCTRSVLSDDQRRELAEWIVDFRMTDSFGVEGLDLKSVFPFIGDVGIEAFRDRVDEAASGGADRPHDLGQMLLELADHDGDVDWAIEILAKNTYPGYGGIVLRLAGAGRAEEACDWARKAVEADRLASDPYLINSDSWVDADLAVDLLAKHGSIEEARQAWRGHFLDQMERRPSVYLWLLATADRFGLRDQEREWALDAATARARKSRQPDSLIRIRISDGDLDGAWQAVDELGAGYVWRELAEIGAKARPLDAAGLYREAACTGLKQTSNRGVYAACASDLKEMCRLYARAGDAEEGRRVVAKLMKDYGHRPAMLDEFWKAGLS